MTMHPEDDAAAARLEPEIDPPPRLRRRVERSLRDRGLLAPRRPAWQPAVAVAAGLALLAGGFGLGLLVGGGSRDRGAADMGPLAVDRDGAVTGFVLLMFEDEDYRPPAAGAELYAHYRAWAGDVRARGVPVSGEKLGAGGVLLERYDGAGPGPAGDREDVVGPDAEAPAAVPSRLLRDYATSPYGELAGYFVLFTTDRATVVALARSCPHLRFGGRILIRPIEAT